MNNIQPSSYLNHFSWEEWDNQMIVLLYRSDRRYVVKRYVERVLSNSSQWQALAHSSFSTVEPITRAYILTENEAQLMHNLLSWHLNGTLTFPIISGLDQLLDWEDLLDFICRAQQTLKDAKQHTSKPKDSASIVPTIPIGVSSSKVLKIKATEKNKSSENSESTKCNGSSSSMNKIVSQPECFNENMLPSLLPYNWVQINHVCVPCLTKTERSCLLPYQVLLDCDLLNEQEQALLIHFTANANANDIEALGSIISSSSTIDFKLDNHLLLIDLYDLMFGFTKVVYVKLLNTQRDVNKKYKTVLAQTGGIAIVRSHPIPFINIGKCHYISLDSLLAILQPKTKTISLLRQQSLPARSYELEYLRLIELYQRKCFHDDNIVSNQQQQLILEFSQIDKYVLESDLVIDMLLTQYQKIGYQKLKKQLEINENKFSRKPTKRKASGTIMEVQRSKTDRS